MKKVFLLAIMLIATEVKTSFALSLFSGYAGISAGAMHAKVTSDSEGSASSQSPLVGIIAGIESNTLFLKFGIEGFAEKALAFSVKDGFIEYKDPFYYGAKGKFLFNLIFFDPYLAVGYGREAGNGGGNFFLGGLGVQAKILHFGAFAEVNYLETSKSGDAKVKRLGLLVGLKYYFF